MADIIITTDGTAQLNIEQQPQPVLSIGAFCTGEKGADGRDGYTPVKGVDYFDGKDGKDGAPGKDGKSLTFDDLTEPQKAQLKGEKGDPGKDGAPGAPGKDADPTKYVAKTGDSITGILIIDGNQAQIVNISRSQDNLFYGGLDFKKIGSAGNPTKTGVWTELGKLKFWGHDGINEKNQAEISVLNNSETTASSGGSYIRTNTRCADGSMFNTANIAANGSSINGCGSVPLTITGIANNVELQLVNNSETGTHLTVPFIIKDDNGTRVRSAHIQTNLYNRTSGNSSSRMTLSTVSNGRLTPAIELSNDMVRLGDSARLKFGLNGPDQIVGTGFPNGVVAAPVGSIYTDKNSTCGAMLWIKKTGTGNTGWTILSGDTGWIDCSTVFDQIFDNSAANNIGVKVRRINNTVYFIVKAAIKTLSEVVINIKNGGFSTGDTVSQILLLQQVRNAGKNSQIQATNYSFMWLPGYTGLKVGDTVIGNCSYLTSAAWPTALTF